MLDWEIFNSSEMSSNTNAFTRMTENLRNQQYDLKKLDDSQIIIKGIPTMTSFMAGILIGVGLVLILIGALSLTLDDPEILSAILFFTVGLSMSVLPFYNYYSRKSFKLAINKEKKLIFVRNNIFVSKSIHVTFSDARGLIFKETEVNTFVDDKSKSSVSRNFTLELDLFNNTNPTLIRFIDRDETVKGFSEYFTNYLAAFMDLKVERKTEK